jgi:hypothetical protein
MEVEHRAYARVGLLGNPSDVYGGRAVSFAVAGLWATVRLRPSEELLIQPHPRHDLVAFPCLSALVRSQSPNPQIFLFPAVSSPRNQLAQSDHAEINRIWQDIVSFVPRWIGID